MKTLLLYFLSVLVTTATVKAQWYSQTYPLVAGWNGIWLPGDATYTTVAEIFSTHAQVSEVWRWNPNPNQVQFTESPLKPSAGTAEWSVWRRGAPADSNFTQMIQG